MVVSPNHMKPGPLGARLTIEVEVDDPHDSFLPAMALAGNADYLVTGDRHAGLFQRGHIEHTQILTSAVFCAEADRLAVWTQERRDGFGRYIDAPYLMKTRRTNGYWIL